MFSRKGKKSGGGIRNFVIPSIHIKQWTLVIILTTFFMMLFSLAMASGHPEDEAKVLEHGVHEKSNSFETDKVSLLGGSITCDETIRGSRENGKFFDFAT